MNSRINQLLTALSGQGVDAMLIASSQNRRYLSGFSGSNGILFIHPEKRLLVTDFRYKEQAGRQAPDYEVVMTSQFLSMFGSIREAAEALGVKRIGFESDRMTVDWAAGAKRDLPGIELIPCGGLVERIRASKDEYEISCIATAQRTAELAFQEVLGIIRPGICEYDIAAEIGYRMAKSGCITSFNTIAASGENGSMPHAVLSNRVIQRGDFITMDFGCVYNGYCSDMTRTVAVGQPSEEMAEVYRIVLEAQRRALDLIAPGVNCFDVDTAARGYISDMGYGEYFGHGLGHSFGLEVHEEPRFSPQCHEHLVPGICISVEPGIYLPGKFGVRIEDTVCITEDGYRNFTSTPKELIIL